MSDVYLRYISFILNFLCFRTALWSSALYVIGWRQWKKPRKYGSGFGGRFKLCCFSIFIESRSCFWAVHNIRVQSSLKALPVGKSTSQLSCFFIVGFFNYYFQFWSWERSRPTKFSQHSDPIIERMWREVGHHIISWSCPNYWYNSSISAR